MKGAAVADKSVESKVRQTVRDNRWLKLLTKDGLMNKMDRELGEHRMVAAL